MSESTQKPPAKQLNRSFQNYDSIHRLNYLYELSKLTNKKYSALSSYYSKNLKLISRKTQQRLDASIKHNICKACNANLHDSPYVALKIKRKQIRRKCLRCGNRKMFPCEDTRGGDAEARVHEIYVGQVSGDGEPSRTGGTNEQGNEVSRPIASEGNERVSVKSEESRLKTDHPVKLESGRSVT